MIRATALVLALLLAATPAWADDACTQEGAIAAAKAAPAVIKYCAATANGCHYSVSIPAQDETDPDKKWLVNVSQIHSIDDAGHPRFMPEGAIFVTVSASCAVSGMQSHGLPAEQ